MQASIGLITVMLIFMILNSSKNSFATAEQMEPNEAPPPEQSETTFNQGVCKVISNRIYYDNQELALKSVNGAVAETEESQQIYNEMKNGMSAISADCLYSLCEKVCVPQPTQLDVICRDIFMKALASTDTPEAEKCKANLIYTNFVTPDERAAFVNGQP